MNRLGHWVIWTAGLACGWALLLTAIILANQGLSAGPLMYSPWLAPAVAFAVVMVLVLAAKMPFWSWVGVPLGGLVVYLVWVWLSRSSSSDWIAYELSLVIPFVLVPLSTVGALAGGLTSALVRRFRQQQGAIT